MEVNLKCRKCGFVNPDTNNFCGECGKSLNYKPLDGLQANNHKIDGAITSDLQKDETKKINENNRKRPSSKIMPRKKRGYFLYISFGLIILLLALFFLIKRPISYAIARQHFASGKYYEAASEFLVLDDYKDSQQQLQESKYLQAIEAINSKDFYVAIDLLNELGNYKDSVEQLKFVNYLRATEIVNDARSSRAILTEAKEILLSMPDYKLSKEFLKAIDNRLIILSRTATPQIIYMQILEPAIGMTEQEVRNSTWGNPIRINTTTTAYGTSQQWVYSNYKYIYFENGIVTAIQDTR